MAKYKIIYAKINFLCIVIISRNVKKKNHRLKEVSLVLKPTILSPDLIPDLTAVSTFPENVKLIDHSGIFRLATMR